MKKVAIFASGSGSNAQKIIEYLDEKDDAEVTLVLSNNSDAFVLERADNFEIPTHVFSRNEFYKEESVLDLLIRLDIDLVVLAGFLWLIPKYILDSFPSRIVNIHPALLPKYGGKGMYGKKVHQAVLDAGEKGSGVTIHYVNDIYDEGEIIGQHECPIETGETLDSLAFKVHQLEYCHYPKAIYNILKKINKPE
ncbi:MAG: phosphoribosylglycinamide formyltransferase-1 [Sphingobacteriales bacterium]